MKGKSVSSNWGKIADAITIAISAWPIIFAAVVAQAFKTWATFRVERGVKLMDLEQLVGSSSFGNVIKQPFVLRRLNLLTFVILLVWCLSPIGSQALQRVTAYSRSDGWGKATAYYVERTGMNPLCSENPDLGPFDRQRGVVLEAASVYFIGQFMAPSGGISARENVAFEDQYGHPLVMLNGKPRSAYGIPVALPSPKVQGDGNETVVASVGDSYESWQFPALTSTFEFTCSPWRSVVWPDINTSTITWSITQTVGLQFSDDSGNTFNPTNSSHIKFWSLIDGYPLTYNASATDPPKQTASWTYAETSCDFHQIFINTTIYCWYDPNTLNNGVAMQESVRIDCQADDPASYANFTLGDPDKLAFVVPDSQVKPEWRTSIKDFSQDFIHAGSPYILQTITTPSEL